MFKSSLEDIQRVIIIFQETISHSKLLKNHLVEGQVEEIVYDFEKFFGGKCIQELRNDIFLHEER